MDIKLEKEKIRKKYFSNGALICISFMGIMGVLFFYLSGIFDVRNMDMLYECFYDNAILIITGAFFFFVSLFCWRLFFLNIVKDPKEEILYLHRNEKNEVYFIDKKGKKYSYDFENDNIEDKCYYCVLKTRDYVCGIIGKSNENWKPKEKRSYWLNCYSPVGNVEDLFLLPIVYITLLPGLISLFTLKGNLKIIGIIFCIVPLYEIVYDLIYKIKLKRANYNDVDESHFIKSYDILVKIFSIIPVCFLFIVFVYIFINLSDLTSKLIFLPFLGGFILALCIVISKCFQNDKLEKLFFKIYIIIFLILWFGFLIFWTIYNIKQKSSYIFLLITIPFWIIGFYILYKKVIKNK